MGVEGQRHAQGGCHEGARLPRSGLVDTYSTPTLLRLVAAHQIEAGRFVTHRFGLDEIAHAYDVFSNPADSGAIKVVMTRG